MTSLLRFAKESIRPSYLKWFFFRLSPENCPAAFRQWRSYPSIPLRNADAGFFSQPENPLDFVFLPMNDWHGLTQRPQQLALALARMDHRCLFLNPHLGREFRQPFPLERDSVISRIADRIFELHVHLPLEPVFHHRRLSQSESQKIARDLSAALRAMGSTQHAAIVSFPAWNAVAEELRKTSKQCKVVYDCHDLIEGLGNIAQDLIDDEDQALKSADSILFTSDWLKDEHLGRNPTLAARSTVIRNAANPNDFPPPGPKPARDTVTIGYTGYLGQWFDVETIRAVAALRPQWNFVLAGPNSQDFPRHELLSLNNVKLPGAVPYREIPSLLKTFDVALIPFKVARLTLATNPVKLYEYFACGLPVVSSALPEVERYTGLAYVASTPEEFVNRIETALAESGDERARRRQVAETETWEQRSQTLVHLLEKV